MSAAIAVGLFVKDRAPRPPGHLVGLACLWYGPARFLMDFLRHPAADARYAGLTPAQYGSLVLALIGLWLLSPRSRSGAGGEPTSP